MNFGTNSSLRNEFDKKFLNTFNSQLKLIHVLITGNIIICPTTKSVKPYLIFSEIHGKQQFFLHEFKRGISVEIHLLQNFLNS